MTHARGPRTHDHSAWMSRSWGDDQGKRLLVPFLRCYGQRMTSTTDHGLMAKVPADVRILLEWFKGLLGEYGRVDEYHRKHRRDRYLKYEPDERRWVFCPAIRDRMDIIDPEGVCERRSDGIRSNKALGEYRGADLTPLRPILARLANMLRDDERSSPWPAW